MHLRSARQSVVVGVLCLLPSLGCSTSEKGAASTTGGSSTEGSAGAGRANAGGPTNGAGVSGTAGSPGIGAAGSPQATGGNATNAVGANGTGEEEAGGTGAAGGAVACAPPTVNLAGADAVVGKLIQFNDNGGWTWFSDERAVVDAKAGKLIIGSIASGGTRDGNIEAVVYDLATGSKVGPIALGNLRADDHSAPGLNIRPDGKYIALWAGHRADCNSYYSVYDGTAWAAPKTFDWTAEGCPWDSNDTHMISYSNVWYMGPALYDIARSVSTSPNLIASMDDGATWAYFGRLTNTPLTGFVAGYYKFWGNNSDRIDFVGTEGHPRDFDNNLWHGSMKAGKIYDSAGTVVDDALAGTSAADSTMNLNLYTQVFKTGSTIGGVALTHAWAHDIIRYADGTIAILGQARVVGTGSVDPDKRMLYFRFDGTAWKATYLANAGTKLYVDEQDYTGLGALVPDDPTTIYISTAYDPSTDTLAPGGKREIWRGTTCDHGATFKWTPVTANSTKDNIRPIVPKWDTSHTALLWMQGTYRSAQSFTESIVGTLTGR